jgi:hypothetical protein
MVPAALMGLDVRKLLERAERVVHACASVVRAADNPGARLGAILGECARAGRDKLTISTDPKIGSLGLWIEQLLAESTGKDGKGHRARRGRNARRALRLRRRPPLRAHRRRQDRHRDGSETEGAGSRRSSGGLSHADGPLRSRRRIFPLGNCDGVRGLASRHQPFDQPNVQESKDATKELLEAYMRDGALPEQDVLATDGVLTIYADEATRAALPRESVGAAIKAHLACAGAGDYIAMLDYFEETPEYEAAVQSIRTHLRDTTRCATTTGYGPRFLHSTGQLHKGGSDAGVFMQLTAPTSRICRSRSSLTRSAL